MTVLLKRAARRAIKSAAAIAKQVANVSRGVGFRDARCSGYAGLQPQPDAFVVLLMRYSVVTRRGQSNWLTGRHAADFDAYRAAVLAEDRLAHRHYLFKNVALPSLLCQNQPLLPDRHRLILFTSDDLPRHAHAELSETLAPYPWASIVKVADDSAPPYGSETQSFVLSKRTSEGVVPYATVRLDDDDALGSSFMERVSGYCLPNLVDAVITFPKGHVGYIDPGTRRFVSFHPANSPLIALGLTHVGAVEGKTQSIISNYSTIFSLGQHDRIADKAKVMVDTSFPAFLRTMYPEQDTGLKHRYSPLRSTPSVNIRDLYGVSEAML